MIFKLILKATSISAVVISCSLYKMAWIQFWNAHFIIISFFVYVFFFSYIVNHQLVNWNNFIVGENSVSSESSNLYTLTPASPAAVVLL